MAAYTVGLDISSINNSLNELLRATVTRIRRCVAVKRVALEKIREDSPEARLYGFKHLSKIIEIQIKSYPRYLKNIDSFISQTPLLREQLASLQPLDKGFISKFRFDANKKKLEGNLTLVESKFEFIKEKASLIYEIVNAQRNSLKPNMSGDEEVHFRRFLSVEFEKSEELINELNSCMEFAFRSLKEMKVLQIRFIKYLERCKSNYFSNVIDDSKVFCDKLEKHISAFYMYKSYIQLIGLCLGFFVPVKEIKAVGFAAAGSVFVLDWMVDWVSGLPEQRRRIKQIMNKVDEEEAKQKRLREEILTSVQRMPSAVTNF